MEATIEYIKLLEQLFIKMVIQSEKKDKKVDEHFAKLLIIFAENGAKPEEIKECLNSKELIDESFKELSSDSEDEKEDFNSNQQNDLLNNYNHPHLKEETITFIIEQNKYRYNYGRGANRTFKDILVPKREDIPSYLREIITPSIKNEIINKEHIKLDTNNWKWFEYSELFTISGSRTTSKEELESYGEGEYPYVTTQAVNNGVEKFYNYYTEQGGVLTVDSAVLGFCSFQEKNFSASDHVEVLTPKFKMNKYVALFLTTLINMEQYRYSYGRKCSQIKLRKSRIKLPVTPSGEPDWQFMEDYIKSLPYSKNLEPIDPNEQIRALKKKLALTEQQLQESKKSAQIINYGTINNDNSKHITIK